MVKMTVDDINEIIKECGAEGIIRYVRSFKNDNNVWNVELENIKTKMRQSCSRAKGRIIQKINNLTQENPKVKNEIIVKDGIEGKKCYKCKEWHPLTEFNNDKNRKGGKSPRCKMCDKKYRINNKEHIKEIQKQYRDENKEELKRKQKEWYNNNKEHVEKYIKENKAKKLEYDRQYRIKNKDKIKEYNKEYRTKNKDKIKAHYEVMKEYYNIKGREYYLREKGNISIKGKKRYNKNKKENIQKIKELLSEMNSVFSELDLPVYGTIYKFENIKTGRVYIGQTIKPFHRRYQLNPIVAWIKERKEKKNQKFLEELIEEDFVYTEILDYGICKWHLDKLEMYYIDKYNSCENGYNNQSGFHNTDDGLEEFNEILKKYNLEFIDNELRRK